MMRVTKHKKTSLAVAAALALGSASAVHAEIGFKAGAWDLSFSGNVNGFATWNSCDTSATVVAGGLACNNGLGGGKEQAIESGLLPSALVFGAKSRQAGWDIGWTIGFYPGITSSATGKHGIGASTIDARQNFLTFGDKTFGTVKVGRDIGLFGSDAILSDMTLLGVGSGGGRSRQATPPSAASASAISTPTGFRRSAIPRRSPAASSIQPACSREWTFSTSRAL